eukprot:CAMPEP_0171304972 /NCGR_PEP_ID=MMETSP0816-20121228/14743_1 /TAXON_ID=420281 /ORGANISM="Proboscia inermis, Strain CCAP1064/1" /LENGTH=166 /DNA_ID=CAMNT_0011785433 /DNA_START=108 /DNA_END=608 /DNA_ORIENTATION=+
MGTWFVIGQKPTFLEKTCSNSVERYTRLDNKDHDIDIDFHYNNAEPITSKLKSLPQKGWIQGTNKEDSSDWIVSPQWPIKMPYPIIEVDTKHYDWIVVGYQSRAYCWIMSRKPVMADDTYEMLTKRLTDKHQYTLDGMRKVPHKWTKAERTKRGLEKDIPDKYLSE